MSRSLLYLPTTKASPAVNVLFNEGWLAYSNMLQEITEDWEIKGTDAPDFLRAI